MVNYKIYKISSNLSSLSQLKKFLKEALNESYIYQLRTNLLSFEKISTYIENNIIEIPQLMINSSTFNWSQKHNKYFVGIHLTSKHLKMCSHADMTSLRKQFKLISASCHNVEEVGLANKLELDFITLSPIQHTSSHPEVKPLGWTVAKNIVRIANPKVYALGGLNLLDLTRACNNGFWGISGISKL
ncbi:hypothetical protein CF386_12030 [Paraphotobacterium marinum]|uniref:Thiamine phosphate synthase/TenI domain-containing protein n=1 Tax=Paraphotobacterium marinum TaxID=1755811 RepID=A0A220VHA4_9GAMM|nr:thiamine phosphate synthase [Paraphotobacterium marinum]ASK79764.1 hypothetical protein CF386_12030 [Paraphotobacterium marinum]